MSGEIAELAERLLTICGIERVISIDDDNSTDSAPEELLAVLNAVEQEVLTEVVGPLLSIESGDRDLIRDCVQTKWKGLSMEVRAALLAGLTPPAEGISESVTLAVDLRATSKLPEIFGDKLERLTLSAWEKQADQFVSDAMPVTLFLVDLSFTGEERGKEEGIRVIASLLRMQPQSRIYCGLLSGLFHTSSVHADSKQIAKDHDLDPQRFVLIPKDSLDIDPRAFLALVKLVVMNQPAGVLRDAVSKAFADCLKQSHNELAALDVFEFERIVCLTSSKEGVWEPDTLLRVLSLFHKKFVRGSLHGDPDVYKTADYLRALSDIRVGKWGGPTKMEITLRRLEWFDDTDINDQHLPIELGDVFRIQSRPNKLYVLIAQPCDLMVRQNGKRHHTVENGLLLEATPINDTANEGDNDLEHDAGFAFKLDFFEPERDWQVNLRKSHYVCLDVLDLCVFQKDGSSCLADGQEMPPLMSEAWRARFPRIAKQMNKICKRYAELMKMTGMKAFVATRIVIGTSVGNVVQCKIDPKSSSIVFDITRVGRLKQPRSGALLTRYANALARDAFEHDLTRRPERVIPASVISESSEKDASSVPEVTIAADSDAHLVQPPSAVEPHTVDKAAPESRPTGE